MKRERDILIDGDWLYEHIATHAGLKHYELKLVTQSWDDDWRDEVIDWLTNGLDQIEIREQKPKRGPTCKTYWPKASDRPRSSADRDCIAEALKEIADAKSRLEVAERSLLTLQREADERRLSELQAAKDEQPAVAA